MSRARVFSDEFYARGPVKRLRRALQLGWRYYVWDLPHYITHRRKLGISPFDWQAMVNPFAELLDRKDDLGEPLDGLGDALSRLAAAGVRLTLPPSRIAALVRCWRHASSVTGDVIECGSYRGATGLLLALLGKHQGVRQKVLLLDTFSSSPRGGALDTLRTKPEYGLPDGYVPALLRQAACLGVEDRVELHQGTFRETFEKLSGDNRRFSLAHIDANLYQSTLDACRFVMPRIAAGGAVVFDDYHGPCDLGARLAIDEFLAPKSLQPRRLAGSSAVLWK